jgi:cell division protein FtsL
MTFGKSNLEAGLDTFITKRTLHRKEAAFKSYDAAVRKKIAPEHAIQQALVEAVKGLSDKERKLETARKAAGLTRFNLAVTHAKEKVAFHKKPTDTKTKPMVTVTKTEDETEARKGRSFKDAVKAVWRVFNAFMQKVLYVGIVIFVILMSVLAAYGVAQAIGVIHVIFFGNEPPTLGYWIIGVIAFAAIIFILLKQTARITRRKEEKLHPTTSHV